VDAGSSERDWLGNSRYEGGDEMTRYLIDTNIICFLVNEKEKLTRKTSDILEDYGNMIYTSSECVKELINLHQSGKITAGIWKSSEDIIKYIINETNIEVKYVKEEHLRTLANLKFFPDHKDPSDRVIVSQAITERIPLISSDRKFFYYKNCGLDFVYNER
jgi:PIN domain nuclease of toxin-antitoxin system